MRGSFPRTQWPGVWVRRTVSILAGFALLGLAGLALAQGHYTLSWWTLSSGGTSSSGSYVLSAAVGQPAAGTLEAGGYRLVGGFVGGLAASATSTPPPAPSGSRLYLPWVVR